MPFRHVKVFLSSSLQAKGITASDVDGCFEPAVLHGNTETVHDGEGFFYERIVCRKGKTTFWILLEGIGLLEARVGLPSDFPGLVIYRETRAPIKRKRSSPPPRRPRRKK